MNGLAARMTRLLTDGLHQQPDLPEETVQSTLHALWLTAAGQPLSAAKAAASSLPTLSADAASRLELMVQRRIAGTPLAHLTGRQLFMGLEMLAGPEALVPRVETEILARAAIGIASELVAKQRAITVIDVCTGCGNVAAAIAHEMPSARVLAADLSAEAVELARRNMAHLLLESRVECRCGDLLAPFGDPAMVGTVDLITCNPPYISSTRLEQLEHAQEGREPRLAFDGGPFGIKILLRFLQEAPRLLAPHGWIAFEVGVGQGEGMQKRMQAGNAFPDVFVHRDAAGAIRALSARR